MNLLFYRTIHGSNTSVRKNDYNKGERLVSEALLKDAGYSDKDAKAGYEWLRDHGTYLNVPTFAYYGSKKKRR